MPIPIPANESDRIDLLQKLNLLESLGDEAYDFVTRIAAKLLDVPMAFITLIDDDYQYFLSQIGSDSEGTEREHAFCAYNILDKNMLIVEDATKDDRFKDNPYVVGEPNIRFYAGAPIDAGDDVMLGSVCVVDTQPRKLTDEQLEMLEALGRQTSYLVKIRRLAVDLGLKVQQVEMLKKLIPKCGRCGNIKTSEEDYWETVDSYLEEFTGVELTSSMCPECDEELNEDLDLV